MIIIYKKYYCSDITFRRSLVVRTSNVFPCGQKRNVVFFTGNTRTIVAIVTICFVSIAPDYSVDRSGTRFTARITTFMHFIQ